MVEEQEVSNSVLRATDAKLKTDNWQYLLDVCDLVRDDPEEACRYVMNTVEARLKQHDANVILRTMSLVSCLAENCGSRLQQAIASKHFTGVLYGLVEGKQVHLAVKREVSKVVKQLANSFKGDPSLKSMMDLHLKIVRKYPHLSSEPEVPQKREMSQDSKLKEERDLEEALRLSLMEQQQQQARYSQTVTSGMQPMQQDVTHQDALHPGQEQRHTSQLFQVKKVRAMYSLNASESDELSFVKGDVITVIEQVYKDWWRGTLRGKVGIFPLNYVTPCPEPTPEELARELEQEREIFEQNGNVNKLLQTLKTSNNVDVSQSQQIGDLYATVTPLRPQITKMIGKYAQKKEELTSLREVLANAEATYNQMLDRAANTYSSTIPMSPNQSQFYDRMQYQPTYYPSSPYAHPRPVINPQDVNGPSQNIRPGIQNQPRQMYMDSSNYTVQYPNEPSNY